MSPCFRLILSPSGSISLNQFKGQSNFLVKDFSTHQKKNVAFDFDVPVIKVD